MLLIIATIFVPSAIVHCNLLVVTIRERRVNFTYRSLFYRLFVIQGSLEIILLIIYFIGRLLIRERLAGNDFIISLDGAHFPNFYYYGTVYYFMNAQVWGVIVQSLGRIAVVCAPQSMITYWVDSVPDVAWALTNTLVPLLLLSRTLFQDPISFLLDADGNAIVSFPPHVSRANTIQCAIITTIAALICACCNALVLRKLAAFKRNFNSNGKHRVLVQLATIGSMHLLAQCAMTVCHLTVAYNAKDQRFVYLFQNLYVIPAMFLTFMTPWMLAITDKNMRKYLARC